MGELDYVVAIIKILAFARVQAYSLLEFDEKFATSIDLRLEETMQYLYVREGKIKKSSKKLSEKSAA